MAAFKKMEWSLEETALLIQEYEKHECLYDTTIKEYKDRDKRKLALQDIATKLQTTADEVSKKFARLRIQFNRERAKNGIPTGDFHQAKVSWVHFEPLKFLTQFYTPKMGRSNLPRLSLDAHCQEKYLRQGQSDEEAASYFTECVKTETQNNDGESEFTPQSSSTKTQPPPRNKSTTKKRKMEHEEITALQGAVLVPNKPFAGGESGATPLPDADDLFGQYISSELKCIADAFTKKLIKHKIQTLLFECQMTTLSASSQLCSAPRPVQNSEPFHHIMRHPSPVRFPACNTDDILNPRPPDQHSPSRSEFSVDSDS